MTVTLSPVLLTVVAALTHGLAAPSPIGSAPGEPVPGWSVHQQQLPLFDLTDLAGHRWSSQELPGHVTFLNIWATWCAPCLEELPLVQRLHERLRDHTGFQLVTLSMDDDPAVARSFIVRHEYSFPVIPAQSWIDEHLPHLPLPSTWILDRAGARQLIWTGALPDPLWVERALQAMEYVNKMR